MSLVSSRNSRSVSSLSLCSLSPTIHGSTDGGVGVRPYSQHRSYRRFHNEQQSANNNTFWGMAWIAASATAGISFLGVSTSPSQTLCESSSSSSSETSPGDDEPEIDPYDNLPEEDEPTHCSICLTYRQVGSSMI